MSVPWGWIKQRPHFLAEGLAESYEVDVFFKRSTTIASKNLLTEVPTKFANLSVDSFRILPFKAMPLFKYMNLDFINRFLLYKQLPDFKEYDYIWVTSAELYSMIANKITSRQKLIYDCMDDAAEFAISLKYKRIRKRTLEAEKQLLSRADYVFVSAEYLKSKILHRAGLALNNVTVVNNAIEIPEISLQQDIPDEIKEKLEVVKKLSNTLLYVGTIAEWFDFEMLITILDNNKSYNLVLIGPTNFNIPKHPQIHYLGTLKRDYIFPFMEASDVLIMPFKVTELIKSVNPVKLYEYIYMGKPVIAPKYSETEKFSEYVYLYDSYDSFGKMLQLSFDKGVSNDFKDKCQLFVQSNTWHERCKRIISCIQSI